MYSLKSIVYIWYKAVLIRGLYKMKKLVYVTLIAALMLALLSACTGGGTKEGELEPLDDKKQVKIKVMYWDERQFYQEYGNLFVSKFPNVEIEVAGMQSIYSDPAGDPDKAFMKLIDEQQPDVLMLQSEHYEKLAAEGKLFPLDAVIEQDEFNTEGIHPAILKLLRDKGDGSLYGLSPTFSSRALFYNIDLFKKHGVDLPTDSMSWEEVFDLAKRFPSDGSPDTRTYGFVGDFTMTLENLIHTIGAAQDLNVLNADASQVVINTDSWKKVFQTALDAAKSPAFSFPDGNTAPPMGSMEEMLKQDLFISGRAAMSINHFYQVESIKQAKQMLTDVTPVNWGIVTAPVDPNNRNQSSYFNVSTIFSVNAASPNLRAAWEFVKYINSEEYAEINAKSLSGRLWSWTAYNTEQDGRKMDAFYSLEPRGNTISEFSKAPSGFVAAYRGVLKSEIDEILADKKTVEEAVKSIQDRAQAELTKAKQAEEAAAASPSASASPSAAKP